MRASSRACAAISAPAAAATPAASLPPARRPAGGPAARACRMQAEASACLQWFPGHAPEQQAVSFWGRAHAPGTWTPHVPGQAACPSRPLSSTDISTQEPSLVDGSAASRRRACQRVRGDAQRQPRERLEHAALGRQCGHVRRQRRRGRLRGRQRRGGGRLGDRGPRVRGRGRGGTLRQRRCGALWRGGRACGLHGDGRRETGGSVARTARARRRLAGRRQARAWRAVVRAGPQPPRRCLSAGEGQPL